VLRRFTNQSGFNLVEVMVVIGILGVLLALAFPSYRAWVENLKTRNAADAFQNGLKLARVEAARRNTNVDFVLTTDVPSPTNLSVTSSTTGTNWLVRANLGASFDYVQSKLGTEGATNVTINATSGVITFTGLGRLTIADQQIDITNPKGDRPLRVTISQAGQIRMCDPDAAGKLSSTDPQRC